MIDPENERPPIMTAAPRQPPLLASTLHVLDRSEMGKSNLLWIGGMTDRSAVVVPGKVLNFS